MAHLLVNFCPAPMVVTWNFIATLLIQLTSYTQKSNENKYELLEERD